MVDSRKGSTSFAERFADQHHLQVDKNAPLPATKVLQKAFGKEAVPEYLTENDKRELAEAAYILFLERQEVKKDIQRMDRLTVSDFLKDAQQQIDSGVLPLITDLSVAASVNIEPAQVEPLSPDQQRVATIRIYAREQMKKREVQRRLPAEPTAPTRLEDKLALIRKGGADTLLKQVRSEAPHDARHQQAQDRLKKIEDQLLAVFQVPGILETYNAGFDRERIGMDKAREVLQLKQFVKELVAQEDRIQRTAWSERRSISLLEQQDYADNIEIRKAILDRVEELLSDPEAIDALRVMELQEYKKQMETDGFAETPSREVLIATIRAMIAKGQKVLLEGESGTGKTELWFHSSQSLFGTKGHSFTGGPDLNLYSIYGTRGMTRDGDVTRMGPLTKSLIDRGGKGSPVFFDELNNAPEDVVMSMKTMLNKGPGDEIEIPIDTEHTYVAGEDWAFGGAMNPKSVRYRTRKELDPAVKRMLVPVPVDYMPPSELYDIFLATLMDNRGGAPLAKQDALETLYHFAEGIGWAQAAFAGKKVIIDGNGTALFDRNGAARGELATLKKTIIDPGRARSMLAGYEKSRAQGKPLMEHLNGELFNFVNDPELPEDDRYYLIEIFTLKGFFGTQDWNASRFNLSSLNDQTLQGWKQGNRAARLSRRITPSEAYLSRQELAKIDPYHKKKGGVSDDLDALIGDDLLALSRQEEAQVDTMPVKIADAMIIISTATNIVEANAGLAHGIRSNDMPASVHEAFVKKVVDLGKTGAVPMTDAIHMLDNYINDGYYGPGSQVDVKMVAESLKSQIEIEAFKKATTVAELDALIVDITQRSTMAVHTLYLDRLESIAKSDPSAASAAVTLLDNYSDNGAYFGFITNLRDQAKTKASAIRNKYIPTETRVDVLNSWIDSIDSRKASSDVHKTYLNRLKVLALGATGADFDQYIKALDDYAEQGVYYNSINNLRNEAQTWANDVRMRTMQNITDITRLEEVIGGASQRKSSSDVHKAYLSKLDALARNGANIHQVLAALDAYVSYGAYYNSINNLRIEAQAKADVVRLRSVRAESDVDSLNLLVQPQTLTSGSDVHKAYLNRLETISNSAMSVSEVQKIVDALQDYSTYGVYMSSLNNLRDDVRSRLQRVKLKHNLT